MRSAAAVLNRLRRWLRGLLSGEPPKPPPDPRALASPWLAAMLDKVGDRYRLGPDTPNGIQLLRRTGKARFNPMRTYLRPDGHVVVCDYEVHVHGGKSIDDGRAMLDRDVGPRLAPLGLRAGADRVETWAGEFLTRRYEGACPDVETAAAAVRFACELSETVMDTAAE